MTTMPSEAIETTSKGMRADWMPSATSDAAYSALADMNSARFGAVVNSEASSLMVSVQTTSPVGARITL